ncbi:MAG: tRNA lysidine(34) synthetase TilS [Candidatus Cryptobacteroides sp.]
MVKLTGEAGIMPPLSSVTLLLAVSGGADSMCLADLALHSSTGIRIAIAHCNFSLRGEESDGDETLVREWASKNGVRLHTAAFGTSGYASSRGISIEMAARELRYRWFSRLCLENGYAAVAVAHNANDNAETLLLNIVRGTGMNGLSGMSPLSFSPEAYEGHKALVLRPMLRFTRKSIEGYAFARGIAYRNDSTNAHSCYKRNRIRNEVFPLLEKINPSFIRTFNREMAYFSDAGNIVGEWCGMMRGRVAEDRPDGGVRIDLASLRQTANWKYLLYHILEPYGFASSVLSSVEDLVSSGRTFSGKRFESDGFVLMTQRDGMLICPKTDSSRPDGTLVISGPGDYSFCGTRFRVEVFDRPGDMPLRQPEGVLILDAERLPFPFVCRAWSYGDWFVPFGMKGRKKLSDFFADLKYTQVQKDSAVILTAASSEASRIAAVLGKRIDEAFRITQKTPSVLRITVL